MSQNCNKDQQVESHGVTLLWQWKSLHLPRSNVNVARSFQYGELLHCFIIFIKNHQPPPIRRQTFGCAMQAKGPGVTNYPSPRAYQKHPWVVWESIKCIIPRFSAYFPRVFTRLLSPRAAKSITMFPDVSLLDLVTVSVAPSLAHRFSLRLCQKLSLRSSSTKYLAAAPGVVVIGHSSSWVRMCSDNLVYINICFRLL